ncbi:hypothetical protein BDU57DRAFT_454537 [Ampelomyces quisqualis]|uniref:C2H2-type domain-containing protein n=1 Tax=Ampelomyces quisqualis TaxID=50730 RepID=A0A6A5QFN6_AMPQU|nr:hypothetical protein BDU57DRAFT_454537 [Ampelomyces quisqualis]
MAHQYSSLPTDWGNLEPSNKVPILDEARSTREGRLDSPARHYPEALIVTNPYLGSSDVRLIALQNTGTLKDHRSQITRDFSGGDVYRYHVSEQYSDPTHSTAPQHLQPPGPISVESDLRYNSAWVDGGSTSVPDSGCFAQPTDTSSSSQYLDPPTHHTSLAPLDIAYDPSLNAFAEHLQSGPLPYIERPWYPGSRVRIPNCPGHPTPLAQPNDFPIYNRSNHEAVEHDEPSCIATYDDHLVAPTNSLHPHTVSSEVIGSTRSETKHTYTTPQGDNTICRRCGAVFTGRYQSGNAARHYRQQHTGQDAEVNMACVCRKCNQHFKRPDARRKHEWRKHGLQDTKPLPRRHGKSLQNEGSYTGTHDTISDQGTVTHAQSLLEEPAHNMLYQVSAHWHGAHRIFATAKSSLGDVRFVYFFQVVFERCEWFVKQLQHQRSDLFHIFDQEVRDLSSQLRFQKHPLSRSSSARSFLVDDQSNTGLDNGEDVNDLNSRGKAPVTTRMSKACSRSYLYPEHGSEMTEPGLILATLESFKRSDYRDLDCPIHKWHLFQNIGGLGSPCNGCAKPYMNGVRQHLLPTYLQQHRGKISFIQRCETCKEDFVDENIWRSEGHGANSCQARSQPHDDSLISWARLFLKIYPTEIHVPSPYCDDSRFLPDALVDWLRNELGLPQVLPTHTLQHSQTPLLTFQERKLSRHGSELPDNPTRLQSFESGLERRAILDTLASIASDLLAYVLAHGHTGSAREQFDVDSLITYYHTRVQQLRRESLAHVNSTQHLDFDLSQALAPLAPCNLQQADTPAIGGATDLAIPAHKPGPFVGRVQISDSDMATQYSSQDHQTGDVSFGFPSSQTSHSYGNLTHADLLPSLDTYFCAPSNPPDYSPSPHSHGQWVSPCDAYLDVPGSSRMPRVLATSQMFLDVDYAMAPSPPESRHSPSHGCADKIGFAQQHNDSPS